MTERVFPPIRDEPVFESVPGGVRDGTQLRFTVNWINYLDQLGNNSNDVPDEIEDELSGLATEVQQVQSFTAELAKRDDELDALSFQVDNLNARIAELEKKLECLSQLVE